MKREIFNRWYKLSAYYWAITMINIPQQANNVLLLHSIDFIVHYFKNIKYNL